MELPRPNRQRLLSACVPQSQLGRTVGAHQLQKFRQGRTTELKKLERQNIDEAIFGYSDGSVYVLRKRAEIFASVEAYHKNHKNQLNELLEKKRLKKLGSSPKSRLDGLNLKLYETLHDISDVPNSEHCIDIFFNTQKDQLSPQSSSTFSPDRRRFSDPLKFRLNPISSSLWRRRQICKE